ncbi:hypothetical protein LTR85_003875 [Meristemomyces frigidus]|nr:hypothetical protein LTR85_003875 [Meristemomyces frigidus]
MSDWLSSRTDLSEPDGPMPSPNVASKTPTKKTPEKKGVELGQKLAKRKSQDFASKIQGWNGHGAGVVQQQDEVVVIEEKADRSKKDDNIIEVILDAPQSNGGGEEENGSGSPTKSTGMPGSGGKASPVILASTRTAREVDPGRKAWVRRKSKPQVEIAAEVKEATTPKKRVVSDGHWRRDRAVKIEVATPEKETQLKPITIRRSVANVGLKVPPSIQDFVEERDAPTRVRPLRKPRSRSGSRERDATPDYQDSGLKVYIKQRKRSQTIQERRDAHTSESSFTAGTSSSFDKPSSSTDVTTPSQSPTKADAPRPATAPRERDSRRSLLRDDETRRDSRQKSRTPVQGETVSRMDAQPEAKPADRQVAPLTPKVFGNRIEGNRIEGWLAGQPDPFVEARDATMTPGPLDVKRKKSRKLDEAESWDEIEDGHRKSSGRRRRSRPSLEHIDIVYADDATDVSLYATPTLKRRGARHDTKSPFKDRPEREQSPTTDELRSSRTLSDAALRRQVSRTENARRFPSTGNRLSTIASAETLQARRPRVPSDASDHPTVIPEGSVLSRASDGDEPRRQTSGLKRKMTKHSDLISVLSMPREDNAGIKSARSIRSRRLHPDDATTGDLMNEVTMDELKYQRELRTLVDGVIPVLLTYVLQKTDATGAKRLFSGSSPDGQAVTKPIVEMGVALERLRGSHKRIPLHSSDDLVRWADSTARVYVDYLKSWRLGFQDIVVNLAPADENDKAPKDKFGSQLGGDGERVDVAYLLKRPLVRLKHLTKTFKGINQINPSAPAQAVAAKYHELVEEARQRSNDERARLEDEAAATIDPTRARDPRSLAPLAGVTIDSTRSVRARDYFDMHLVHSSGQQLVCKIEAVLRDDAPERGNSSDILFCEVSIAGRWLLFPPMPASYVSVRAGDKEGEIIVMVRGMLAGGKEWREIMSLQSDDDAAVAEWLDMLSSTPEPPRLTERSSFGTLREPYLMSGGLGRASTIVRPPSPSEVDVPIGERATSAAQHWDGSEVNSVIGDEPRPSLRRAKAKRYRSTPSSPTTEDSYEQVHSRAHRIAEQERYTDGPLHGSRSGDLYRPKSSYMPSRTRSDWTTTSSTVSTPTKDYSVWLPSTDRGSSEEDSASDDERTEAHRSSRPGMHRRTSSVPSTDMPTVNKIRNSSQPGQRQASNPRRPDPVLPLSQQEPSSAPAKLQKRRPIPSKDDPKKQDAGPQATPTHTRPTSLGLRSSILPSFTPAFLKRHRRSSSPLKHEYEPSTASESLSESELSDLDDVESVTSESSADEDAAISTVGELKDFRTRGAFNRPVSQPPPPKPTFSAGPESVGPSDSASQRPYRTVPPLSGRPAETVACIFAWADRGSWDSLHPQECSIVVTPGLIEAFDLTQAAHAPNSGNGAQESPSERGVKPLVALELTPLVPLRRGTALDISVRSPPTPNSVLRTSNNIMFRSRSPEECEMLYSLINRARIDNPTYIALQNARGPVATSNWAEVMDKKNAARTNSSSWLRLGSKKSSTYRSKGSRPVSIAATESSVGTTNSAFSALRRFSGGSRVFNIAKSTLTSREGTRSTYSDSLSSGAATPIPIDPRMGTPLGVTNVKIRLYIRETASKWRDMGSARLTVMLPPRQDPTVPANPKTTGMEKRILISGKSAGEVLLDATLGESCFERVARTGIAVSVWEEAVGPNGEVRVGAVGGVSSVRSKVYMVQMKSEREAAYTFGMVGKLRY